MAKQSPTNSFESLLGAKGQQSVQTHKKDSTEYDNAASLPPGIEGGIAQLVDIKFDVYKKGDNAGSPYFYAAGVVVSPEEYNGIRVKGLRTSIMEPLHDTPKRKSRPTTDDHIAWVMNEMRKLGVDTDAAGFTMDKGIAALKKLSPFFNFRTWIGDPTPEYPTPRTNEVWNGKCDPVAPSASKVEDDTDDASYPASETETAEEEAAEEGSTMELEALGESADGGDQEAAAQLTELASARDIDPNEYATWSEVAALLQEGDDTAGEVAPEENESGDVEPPKKEDIYYYKPKGAKKAVECEVTAVFPTPQLVNLKNLDNKEIYKQVKWTDLLDEE